MDTCLCPLCNADTWICPFDVYIKEVWLLIYGHIIFMFTWHLIKWLCTFGDQIYEVKIRKFFIMQILSLRIE